MMIRTENATILTPSDDYPGYRGCYTELLSMDRPMNVWNGVVSAGDCRSRTIHYEDLSGGGDDGGDQNQKQ